MRAFLRLFGYYLPIMPQRYVYMLQQVEYSGRKLLQWLLKGPNLIYLIRRGTLKPTRKAQALLVAGYGTYLLILFAAGLAWWQGFWLVGAALLVGLPLLIALVLAIIVTLGNGALYILRWPLLGKAHRQLQAHPAVKIAVLGSYGKTTMKELLVTVLSEGKRVKATPGNMNVPISHARWVTAKVAQDEEILIFEYGEGRPGDIARFARLTQPTYGVITGLAPNHLDRYPDLAAVATDLLSIRNFIDDSQLLLNAAAAELHKQAPNIPVYDENGVQDWKVSDIGIDYDGTRFKMKNKDGVVLSLQSQLLGRHQVGPLAAVAATAYQLGLNVTQIEAGIAKTKPFQHRMEARPLHSAWIIDDTYNGNLEGIRAGLQLMNDLKATRKTYVTPGLVDQGVETERVHLEIGKLIAQARPDKVVLMQNSATASIQAGLEAGKYAGEVIIEDNPLNFYTNIEHTVAAGDLVVMQNDWTDNYL